LPIRSPESESKLLAVAGQPLRDVLVIMLDTGMRSEEVFRMRWEHVDFRQRLIFNPFGKTKNSRRYVPVSERMLEALWLKAAGKTEGWVFPSNSKSGHLTTVAKAFSDACKRAGLSKSVVLYCARHTFGTYMLSATGNLAAVMKAMGLASAQTAMIYQHPGLDAIRRAVDEKNKMLAVTSQIRHTPLLLQ
jgi:integrase